MRLSSDTRELNISCWRLQMIFLDRILGLLETFWIVEDIYRWLVNNRKALVTSVWTFHANFMEVLGLYLQWEYQPIIWQWDAIKVINQYHNNRERLNGIYEHDVKWVCGACQQEVWWYRKITMGVQNILQVLAHVVFVYRILIEPLLCVPYSQGFRVPKLKGCWKKNQPFCFIPLVCLGPCFSSARRNFGRSNRRWIFFSLVFSLVTYFEAY